jgi:hypothetical protein
LPTNAKSIQCFQKHTKLVENRFSRLKVIQNSIDESVGTSHKALERLALREIAFSQLAVKGLTQHSFFLHIFFALHRSVDGRQDSLVDKALDYRPKGTGFDARLDHKKAINMSD